MPDIRTKANMTAAFDTFIEFAESPTGALGVNPVRRVFADAKSGRKFTLPKEFQSQFQYLADCTFYFNLKQDLGLKCSAWEVFGYK